MASLEGWKAPDFKNWPLPFETPPSQPYANSSPSLLDRKSPADGQVRIAMQKEINNDEEISNNHFDLRLLIKHPTIDPQEITHRLGMHPRSQAKAGSQRMTPTGTLLPGKHKQSFWGWSERVEGKRDFLAEMVRLATSLDKHREYISHIVETGGVVEVLVHLAGTVNIGADMRWQDLKAISDLKIGLGIEVFPEFS